MNHDYPTNHICTEACLDSPELTLEERIAMLRSEANLLEEYTNGNK